MSYVISANGPSANILTPLHESFVRLRNKNIEALTPFSSMDNQSIHTAISASVLLAGSGDFGSCVDVTIVGGKEPRSVCIMIASSEQRTDDDLSLEVMEE